MYCGLVHGCIAQTIYNQAFSIVYTDTESDHSNQSLPYRYNQDFIVIKTIILGDTDVGGTLTPLYITKLTNYILLWYINNIPAVSLSSFILLTMLPRQLSFSITSSTTSSISGFLLTAFST